MALAEQIRTGHSVAREANRARAELRWRQSPGSTERQGRIHSLLTQINAAMQPIRSAIGTLAWGGQEAARYEDDLRDVSQQLQYERKQLKKMLR